jgi:mannose-6-phosphate isomerase-like protein (cupin superfamily)
MKSRLIGGLDARCAFVEKEAVRPTTIAADHDGQGTILFRRLATSAAFASGIDFVDFTSIPPGSTIGRHEHQGNEELYLIVSGTPLVRVQGEERRLKRGDITIVRSSQWHQLVNDTDEAVEIFVVQVRL